jgi:phosphohistidine swiveling domain-containing protein
MQQEKEAMRTRERAVTRAATLDIGDPRAALVGFTGVKASNLAKARATGFPVLSGFVITTESEGPESLTDPDFQVELKRLWNRLTARGARPVVVRSSSVAEDRLGSSMAGMFRSVTNVATWPDLIKAIEDVYRSAVTPLRREPAPMAVLVQPHVKAVLGGVMFGIDPITGRQDRIVVAAVAGSPEILVGGEAEGTRLAMTRRGRTIERVAGSGGLELSFKQRRRLAGLARRAAAAFGGPQDIEWAEDAGGRLWMLQTRPVTAAADEAETIGPVLGPGPVAETFPDPLAPLEQDLWLEPFREGLRGALAIAGVHPRKRIDSSPVVTTIGGRAAVDLDLLEALPRRRSMIARLDPRRPARRLAAAWRVGRLRAALPGLAQDLVGRVNDELAAIRALNDYEDGDLITFLKRAQRILVALHGHESLAGILVPVGDGAQTTASRALRALAKARNERTPEHHIAGAYPEVLSLFPPAIAPTPELPPSVHSSAPPRSDSDPVGAARESLRFAVRLVQELSVRAALELGRRGVTAGALRHADEIKWLRLDELEATIKGRLISLEPRSARRRACPPLPATFRLTPSGTVVPEPSNLPPPGGRAAGGGRAIGTVRRSIDNVRPGDVLVVRTLDPRLAAALPRLGGLVAETGSVLSHLAILAREFGVPTVVGVRGAVDRFPPGSTVVIDGIMGDVSPVTGDGRV